MIHPASLMLLGSLLAMRRPAKVIVIEMIRDEQARTYMHDVYFLPDSNPGAINLPPRTTMVEKPGEAIDIVVTLAPGRYYFQCDPHVSRGMIGHLRVRPTTPATRSAIVIVVRHADKASAATNDPPLSDAGRLRATALADALRDAGVTRILVDQSQRTQETATPLGQRRGLRPDVIPIDWNDPAPQVRAIVDSVKRPGAVTLVIGHRNTVPEIIRMLGGPTVPEMRDTDYDDLYVLVLDAGSATPVLIHSSYGR